MNQLRTALKCLASDLSNGVDPATALKNYDLVKDYDPDSSFPYGLPPYDGSDDDDGGTDSGMFSCDDCGSSFGCPNCGMSKSSHSGSDILYKSAKSDGYLEKATEITDPILRKGYLKLAAKVDKGAK